MPDILADLHEAAAPLLPVISLSEVRLFSSSAEFEEFPSGPGSRLAVSLDVHIAPAPQGEGDAVTSLVVLLTTDARVEEFDANDAFVRRIATFNVTYGALYHLDDGSTSANVTENALSAFARCVASLTLWPYVRAEVARCAEAMHLGNLTLPIFTERQMANATTVDALPEDTDTQSE